MADKHLEMDSLVHAATAKRGFAAVLIVTLLWNCSGCSTAKPQPVSLTYTVAQNEKTATSAADLQMAIIPFKDARTDPFLYRKSLKLASGQDAGVWMANAIRVEVERAGGSVEALPADTPPTTGRVVTGRINLLKAEATGWHLGGILAALIGTGYKPHISASIVVYDQGVPVLSKQYDIKRNVPSNAGHVIMWGFPPAHRDVPVAFGKVLKKLIREQVVPDLAAAGTPSAALSSSRQVRR